MPLDFGVHEFSWQEGRSQLSTQGRREGGQRGKLVQSARKLYEASSVKKTTISAICAEAGITRELFYYYFKDKDELTKAVLNDYVTDFTESVILWNESRVDGEMPLEIKKHIRMFRRCLFDEQNHLRPMFRVSKELGIGDAVLTTAIYEMTRYLSDDTLTDYAKHHKIELDLAAEMIYSAIFGIAGLLLIDPEISDDRLCKVYAQMLRLDIDLAKSRSC